MKIRKLSRYFIVITLGLAVLAAPADIGRTATITDLVGRTIKIPDPPRRLIALAPSITEIIFAVGKGHLLVGATQFSDYPAEANQLPKIGSYVHLDLEKIIALKPDLCIAIREGNPLDMIARIESLNIPVFAINPTDLESVMDTILALGRLTGGEDRARQVVDDMQTRITNVATRIAKAKTRPRVFFQIGIAPVVSAGTKTFIHQLIDKAGGDNIAQGPVSYPRFNMEQIIRLSPEILIITSMARDVTFESVKNEWLRWKAIPAVKNGQIHLVESDLLDRPTPRLVDGLEVLAALIHPELFEAPQ